MTGIRTLPLPLPREDVCPFGPAPELTEIRQGDSPVTRVDCPTGIQAWLVTRYADVREVLGDPRRFGNACGQAGHVLANMPPDKPLEEGEFARMDGGDHVRFRRVFAAAVTRPKRIEAMRPLVGRIADTLLDELAAATGPVDLYAGFAKPLTSAVIAGLFDVPSADWSLFQDAAETLFSAVTDVDDLEDVKLPLADYLVDLIEHRRAAPGEDALSLLVSHGQAATPPMTDFEIVRMAMGLLVAGYDTTASMLSHSLLALLDDRTAYESLVADPDRVTGAVEELVRLLGDGTGIMRVALSDTEIGGVPIAAGDYLITAIQAANHDPARFADPGRLDLARERNQHIGFGYGPHQCVGQQIARLELTTALATIVRRIPSLRLAVPLAEITFKAATAVCGPTALPVTWDEVLPAG